MKTDQRVKANSQFSAPVTPSYPLPPLTFTSFRVDPKDGCIGVSKKPQRARERFTTTTTMMREMEMGLWLENAEAELKELQ